MLNQIVLVGRIVSDFQVEEKNGMKIAKNQLAIPRSFKNKDGVYETDFIPFTLLNNIAKNTVEYCAKGDLIGIKGRLSSYKNNIQVEVEKLTFLSTKKEKTVNDEEIDKNI